jgi:dihydroneopterin aldolase
MSIRILDAGDTCPAARSAAPDDALRHVLIKNFVLPCHIGVHAHEHGRAQRVRISLDLAVLDTDPIGDDLRNVVCYDEIISAVRRLATLGHVRLIETLAERIAALCLNDPRIRTVRVEVEKLDVYEDVEAVGVSILRYNRED